MARFKNPGYRLHYRGFLFFSTSTTQGKQVIMFQYFVRRVATAERILFPAGLYES